MLGFIIASLIIGVILLSVAVYNIVEYDKCEYIALIIIAGTYLLCSILYFALSYPTDNDVRNGTAEYVKEHHIEISSNDTIEYDLYRLDWVNK